MGQRRLVRARGPAVLLLCVIGVLVWWFTRATSGDPGGRILAQILPAASALPGYGTSSLPQMPSPRATGPYLIESEPHETSCDGRAGTYGWSSVVVQGRFSYAGSRATLFKVIGRRLTALRWTVVPHVRSTVTEHLWTKVLQGGSKAHAMLTFTPGGRPPWTFVVTAPPSTHASSGC